MFKVKREYLNHFYIGITYVVYIFLLTLQDVDAQDSFSGIFNAGKAILINHFFISIHFYTSSFFILPLFFKTERFRAFITLCFSLSCFCLTRYITNIIIFPLIGILNRYAEVSTNFYVDTIWVYFLWFGYALGYFYARKSIEQEKELRILQVEKAEAEMRFLKAQINPHFMFNTLNLIHNKIMKANKSASDIILQLAEMFRYMTGKEGKQDLVKLQREVDFVFNYVDMLNKRNSYSMAVAIDQEGDFSKHMITPMVLITILENAFKHGDVFDHDFPLIITMIIDENNLFTFSTANKIKVEEQKGGDTGIGISNITRRLAVVHGSAYTLDSYLGEQQEYICKLTIQY
jgi:two-component system, LytTR family, sensor kinase